MLLVIDNYDSFVYNLARYCELSGWERVVTRNDKITIEDIERAPPEAIVISPGPCTPKEAGVSTKIIRRFGHTIPILGICLGHQCIGEAFGAKTSRAEKPVHGKATAITHTGDGIFDGLPSPMDVGRYHSLIVEEPAANSDLVITAWSFEDEIMAMRHARYPIYGLQFHPESVLTEHGQKLIDNFTDLAREWNGKTERSAA
jgi:para-aminobenzoate synthetase component 2